MTPNDLFEVCFNFTISFVPYHKLYSITLLMEPNDLFEVHVSASQYHLVHLGDRWSG